MQDLLKPDIPLVCADLQVPSTSDVMPLENGHLCKLERQPLNLTFGTQTYNGFGLSYQFGALDLSALPEKHLGTILNSANLGAAIKTYQTVQQARVKHGAPLLNATFVCGLPCISE